MLRPCTRDEAREAVRRWHSHHKPHLQQILAIGWEWEWTGEIVAVVVLESPKARALMNGRTWEVSRLCVGPDAPDHAASKLLGAAWRSASGAGVRRLISHTRVDEDGTCYRAAGWFATEVRRGEPWTHGAYATRWLPGLYVPSTETIDRVRWEIGPDAAVTRVHRVDGAWCDKAA